MSGYDFRGQVAIVTGGGRNLGRGYCLELSRRGAAVVVNDIDQVAAQNVVEEIERAGGKAVASFDTVANVAGGASIVAQAVETYGTVDIVINNAGNVHAGDFADMPFANFEDVLAVHVSGAFCVTQPAWKIMQGKGRGRIIMTGSAGGVYPEQGYSEYATAKASIIGLTRALAAEGAAHGIHVNAILPQAGGSSMTDHAEPIPFLKDPKFNGPDAALSPYKSVEAVIPIVLYLASLECAQTGLILSAGAGWFGRVFLGLTHGWTAGRHGEPPSVQDIANHLSEITSTEKYTIPAGASDELLHIAECLGLM